MRPALPPVWFMLILLTEQDIICAEEVPAGVFLKYHIKASPRKFNGIPRLPQKLKNIEGSFEILEAECKQKIFP